MKFADIDQETIEKLKVRRYDRIVEKHEGQWDWKWQIQANECEFIKAGEHFVLLPVYLEQIPNITILRIIESKDGKSLTIFLKDTTDIIGNNEMLNSVRICFPRINAKRRENKEI